MRRSMTITVAAAFAALLAAAFSAAVRAGDADTRAAATSPAAPGAAPSNAVRQHPTTGPAPVIFQVHWRPQAQFAGYIMAQEKGFFAQAGAGGVKIEYYLGGATPLERLCAGQTSFCTAWLAPAIRERSQGRNIVNLAQIMQRSSMMLVARKDSGIREPNDLTGRRVGMWGADFDVQANAFFAKFGAKPAIVAQDFSITPFLRGAVEVASAMYYNEYHKMLEAGLRPEDLRVFLLSDYGMDFPEDGIYCTQEALAKDPALCAAVAAASIRGWAYALSHEDETLDVVMKLSLDQRISTNRNHQRWMLRAMGQFIRYRVGDDPAGWGSLSPQAYADVAKVLTDQGMIARTPPFGEFRPAVASGARQP